MRVPLDSPPLDQIDDIVLTDLEPARIRHLQRADLYAHALLSAWGGPGFYVPLHLAQTDTPDDPTIPILVPAGLEFFEVTAIASCKQTKSEAVCTLTSANSGGSCTLRWANTISDTSLDGAAVVAADTPLRVRHLNLWQSEVDIITVTFDSGSGILWGLLFSPVYTP